MAFKYRLETSLRLAEQELDVAQSLLAKEMRILYKIKQERDDQAEIFTKAIEGQKLACIKQPQYLSLWQRYLEEQKNKLRKIEQDVILQEKKTIESREMLIRCRIAREKYKRLKENKWKIYQIEELRKEQVVIDEIPQSKSAREIANSGGHHDLCNEN